MNELVIVGSELYEEARGIFFFSFFLFCFFFSNSVMAFLMMMMMMMRLRLRYVPLGIHFSSSRVC